MRQFARRWAGKACLIPNGYRFTAGRVGVLRRHWGIPRFEPTLCAGGGGYGERVRDPAALLAALERAVRAVTAEKAPDTSQHHLPWAVTSPRFDLCRPWYLPIEISLAIHTYPNN